MDLNLDDLHVESFDTTPDTQDAQGGVHAYGPKTTTIACGPTGNYTGCETSAYSCGGTCLYQRTCGHICLYD